MITVLLPRCPIKPLRLHLVRWWGELGAFALLFSVVGAKPILPASLAGFAAAGPAVSAGPASALLSDDVPLGSAQFDTIAVPMPPNAPSVGHEAAATSEFGDLVRLSGAAHFIDSVTVTMSSWAIRSDFPGSSPPSLMIPRQFHL